MRHIIIKYKYEFLVSLKYYLEVNKWPRIVIGMSLTFFSSVLSPSFTNSWKTRVRYRYFFNLKESRSSCVGCICTTNEQILCSSKSNFWPFHQQQTWISIHSKVSRPNSVTYLDRTPIFEWWVVKCTSKNGTKKTCSTLKRTNQAKLGCRCFWSNLRGIEQVFLELRFFPLVAIEVPNHLVNWFVRIYYKHFSLNFEAPQTL